MYIYVYIHTQYHHTYFHNYTSVYSYHLHMCSSVGVAHLCASQPALAALCRTAPTMHAVFRIQCLLVPLSVSLLRCVLMQPLHLKYSVGRKSLCCTRHVEGSLRPPRAGSNSVSFGSQRPPRGLRKSSEVCQYLGLRGPSAQQQEIHEHRIHKKKKFTKKSRRPKNRHRQNRRQQNRHQFNFRCFMFWDGRVGLRRRLCFPYYS